MSAASAIAIGMLTGCGGDSSSTGSNGTGGNNSSANATVQALPSLAFAPSSVTISPGQSVAWVFGSVGHTVTFTAGVANNPADIGSVDSPNLNTTITRTFPVAGTYYYHCSIHPTLMSGVVFVGATGVDTSTTGTDTTGGYTGKGLRTGGL